MAHPLVEGKLIMCERNSVNPRHNSCEAIATGWRIGLTALEGDE
jgi:hypothetical protein